MTNKLAELEEDRNAGKAGAQERLKLFRAERILFVDSIIQVSYRASSTWCCNNHSSYRAAPNLRNGQRKKQKPRLIFLRKEGPKDVKRE
jgi:hypothetical protein